MATSHSFRSGFIVMQLTGRGRDRRLRCAAVSFLGVVLAVRQLVASAGAPAIGPCSAQRPRASTSAVPATNSSHIIEERRSVHALP